MTPALAERRWLVEHTIGVTGMKTASGPFTLAQLARAVGMSVEDVKRCRDLGLLPSPRRRRGRTDDRGFHREHVDRLRFIARALEHGFLPDAVARLFKPDTLLTCNDVYNIASEQLERVRRDKARADAAIALEALMAKCPKVGARRDCPILAAFAGREGRRPTTG
jgi:DNA-binding transcriptional MerR regulator